MGILTGYLILKESIGERIEGKETEKNILATINGLTEEKRTKSFEES